MLFFRGNNTLFKPKAVSTYCSNIEATHIINSHTETRFSVLRLHTSSQSACELSSISKKHNHRGHAEKNIITHTKKLNHALTVTSATFGPVCLCHAGHVCACVHTCMGERACESRQARTHLFLHKQATHSR